MDYHPSRLRLEY